MAEEIVNKEDVVVDPVENTEVVTQTPAEPTATELEAMNDGWTPKDQWRGDPDKWRPADVWVDRGQMIRTISALRGEVKNTTAQLTAQVGAAFKQGKAIAEAQFKEQIGELKAARRQALEQGDFVTADKLDDRIDQVKENQNKPVDIPTVRGIPPEFNVFVDRNPWYNTNSVMQHTANAVGAQFLKDKPNGTPAELYWHVESQMKENFPQLYGGRTTKGNSPVPGTESGGTSGKSSTSGDAELAGLKRDMSDMDLGIMKTLVKNGDFKNEAEYLKEYAKAPSRR